MEFIQCLSCKHFMLARNLIMLILLITTWTQSRVQSAAGLCWNWLTEWKLIPCFMFRFSLFWRGGWLWWEALAALLSAVPAPPRPPRLPLLSPPTRPWQPRPRPESAQRQDGEQQQHGGRGPGAGHQDQDGGGGVHRLRQGRRGLPPPPGRGQARAGEQEPRRRRWDQINITRHVSCIVSQEAREEAPEPRSRPSSWRFWRQHSVRLPSRLVTSGSSSPRRRGWACELFR